VLMVSCCVRCCEQPALHCGHEDGGPQQPPANPAACCSSTSSGKTSCPDLMQIPAKAAAKGKGSGPVRPCLQT